MSTQLIIIVCCAAGAFVLSLAITFIIARKSMSRRCHYLSEFVSYAIPNAKKYTFVMSEKDGEGCIIAGFNESGLAVCSCVYKNGSLEFSQPKFLNEENLSFIRLSRMRTHAQLYDRDGSLACTLDVLQKTTKEIYPDFPADIDFNDDALKFYDYIDELQKKLENRQNRR